MNNKQTVELFSGTGSFSQVALKLGYQIKTYDIATHADELVEGTHTTCDILDRSIDYPKRPFILWASPPCTGFSVASIGHHWHKETREPKTETAKLGLAILERTVELIRILKPQYWFIENPRAMMRKKIEYVLNKYDYSINQDFFLHDPDQFLIEGMPSSSSLFETSYEQVWQKTITYCQYGEERMKPTDIWTNCWFWESRPPCKYGQDCHVSAPRGSSTGTQGIKGNRERSRIPLELFDEIFSHINLRKDKE